MGNGWTPERRARQAEAIQRWKPWDKSTGPRTDEGKKSSRKNAHRVTFRGLNNIAGYLLRQQKLYLAGKPFDGFAEITRRMNWAWGEGGTRVIVKFGAR